MAAAAPEPVLPEKRQAGENVKVVHLAEGGLGKAARLAHLFVDFVVHLELFVDFVLIEVLLFDLFSYFE